MTKRETSTDFPGLENMIDKEPEQNKVNKLIAELKHPDYYIRCDAAYALGESKDVRAIKPLLELLTEPEIPHARPAMDSEVRSRASVALSKIGEQVVPVLINALSEIQNDPDGRIRYWIIDALGLTKDQRSVEPLIHSLSSGHRAICESAIVALGRIRDPRALDPIISTFQNLDPLHGYLYFAAVEALGYIGGEQALQVLEEALACLKPDRDKVAHDSIVDAIQRIQSEHR